MALVVLHRFTAVIIIVTPASLVPAVLPIAGRVKSLTALLVPALQNAPVIIVCTVFVVPRQFTVAIPIVTAEKPVPAVPAIAAPAKPRKNPMAQVVQKHQSANRAFVILPIQRLVEFVASRIILVAEIMRVTRMKHAHHVLAIVALVKQPKNPMAPLVPALQNAPAATVFTAFAVPPPPIAVIPIVITANPHPAVRLIVPPQ